MADLSNDQIIHQRNDIQTFDLILRKLNWWLVGEMYCKLSGRAASVRKVWKELSLMLADGGVRKEIEVCQSCRTCEDRDDANYPHPHCPCMSRTIRVNVVSSTNGSTSRSWPGGVSVMEIDINLISWKGDQSLVPSRGSTTLLGIVSNCFTESPWTTAAKFMACLFFNHGQLGNWDHAFWEASLPFIERVVISKNLGILGLDMTNWW